MFGFLGDLARIAVAPVKVAVEVAAPVLNLADDVVRTVTKPVADLVEDVTDPFRR